MKYLIPLLLTTTLSLGTANAEDTKERVEYDFELIIFEDTSGRYANSEQWQDSLFDDTSGTEIVATPESSPDEAKRNPGKTDASKKEFTITNIEGIGLDKYAQSLEKAKRYKVLVHKAWRQPGLAEQEAIDIPIDSRVTGSLQKTTPGGTAQPPELVADTNNIHGTIKVVLARYLHFYTDLVYQQPREETSPLWDIEGLEPYKEYPIKFHRRMRSKELHYLDHPMIGILIKAMPVEKPEKIIEEST